MALDERPFHHWLRKFLLPGSRVLLGAGDDAAALRGTGRSPVWLTSDALVEQYHFLRASPASSIGAAVVGVNLSDLAAKGATPIALLIDLIAPPGTPRRWAEGVLRGAQKAAQHYRTPIVGGDTKPGATRAVVGFAAGVSPGPHFPTRAGARPGDLLVTTGPVGRGGWREFRMRQRPGPTALRRLLEITPRLEEGKRLAGHAHAMIDTSDGIAEAVHLLAEASDVRMVLQEAALPIEPALRRAVRERSRRLEIAFRGGDYELLAAVPSGRRSLKSEFPSVVVGRVESGSGAWLERGGKLLPLPHSTWQPFRRRAKR
ncbi:MAG TPA: thiamine-phosphate kinase [Thermoplasmata archaeon]|nr:thiamine-phosphate kinase [Thermoplasmata archaeon]